MFIMSVELRAILRNYTLLLKKSVTNKKHFRIYEIIYVLTTPPTT